MGQPSRPIRIRTLPRSSEENSSADKHAKKIMEKARINQLIRTYVVVGVAVCLAFMLIFWDSPDGKKQARVSHAQDAETPEALVNRYLKEAQMKRKLEMRNRELENKVFTKPLAEGATIIPQSDRTLGVSLDQENSAEKVYNDLYGKDKRNTGPISPDDRINMRIEQEQWLTQEEKEERKTYIQNFLRDAYKAGYAIQLDDNLVVIKVRKITSRPSETLDKVLEDLARKGY